MLDKYSLSAIEELQKRIKEFIKGSKEPEPRIMYIADYHFYHSRMNSFMDKRGFASVEEMNEHMVS